MITAMEPGSIVSFETYAPNILGNGFTNVEVTSKLTYGDALDLADIIAPQKQVFPYLPDGTSNDQKTYTYYRIKFPDGQRTIVADAWINPGSVVVRSNHKIVLELFEVAPEKLALAKEMCSANGFKVFTANLVALS